MAMAVAGRRRPWAAWQGRPEASTGRGKERGRAKAPTLALGSSEEAAWRAGHGKQARRADALAASVMQGGGGACGGWATCGARGQCGGPLYRRGKAVGQSGCGGGRRARRAALMALGVAARGAVARFEAAPGRCDGSGRSKRRAGTWRGRLLCSASGCAARAARRGAVLCSAAARAARQHRKAVAVHRSTGGTASGTAAWNAFCARARARAVRGCDGTSQRRAGCAASGGRVRRVARA